MSEALPERAPLNEGTAAGDPDAWADFDARYLQVDEAGYRAAVAAASGSSGSAR